VALGLLCMIAGVIVLAEPKNSLATIAVVIGIFLVLDGAIEVIVSLLSGGDGRALTVLIGVVSIVVGIILIRHPTHAVNAIGLVIGIWLIVAGAARLLRAIALGGLLRLAIAVLEIVVGIVVVSDPHIGYATLAVLIGIWLVINGLAWIGLGFVVRAAARAAR